MLGEKRPQVFDDKSLHIMTVLSGQAAVALENYLLNNRLSQVLSRDTLTGLLSFDTLWGIVSEHCASPQAAGYTMGLILLDIDRFKIFNCSNNALKLEIGTNLSITEYRPKKFS